MIYPTSNFLMVIMVAMVMVVMSVMSVMVFGRDGTKLTFKFDSPCNLLLAAFAIFSMFLCCVNCAVKMECSGRISLLI